MTMYRESTIPAQIPQPAVKFVPKVSATDLPYAVFLKEFVEPNLPVVVQHAVPQWKALERWTPHFFLENFGERRVEVTYGVQARLGDVIAGVLASTVEKPGPYLHKVIIHQHMPELLPDLSPENTYGFPRRYCSPLMPGQFRRPDGYLKLLIGGVGGKFPIMHYDADNAHAVITEIFGDKEFVLFAPNDTSYVYPHANSPSTSQIEDLDRVDPDRFPAFYKAVQYRTVIGPGECIFVPSRWWHSARVISTSISVCTNVMHSSNWGGFVSLCCDPKAFTSTPKNIAKRFYFQLSGAVMDAVENLQVQWPSSPFTRKLGYLSPFAPQFARRT